ncbi:HU family DNA-binding protein [Treponema putidum]|uniref:HU family DNA-binding protein n=1 Tax=Treponema putidum TaxID=221027 RepID=UPI003D92D0D5
MVSNNTSKNKTDVIINIAEATGLSCKQISEVLNYFFDYIIKNNIQGNAVKINKFGTFYIQNFNYDKNQYDFVTKKNKKLKTVKRSIQFKMSKHLKNSLNNNLDNSTILL